MTSEHHNIIYRCKDPRISIVSCDLCPCVCKAAKRKGHTD